MTGPFVIAGSVMLAITIVLFSTHQMTAVGSPNAWLPQMLNVGSLIEYDHSSILFNNITGKIMEEMERNGTGPCYNQHTNSTKVIGLPDGDLIVLSTNVVHKFWLQSYTKTGDSRCAGGDYYELDLSSPLWKSRPPSKDCTTALTQWNSWSLMFTPAITTSPRSFSSTPITAWIIMGRPGVSRNSPPR